MTAATRARDDGAGSFPAAGVRVIEDLELPRPLRLALTAGWSVTESVGLPVAAYVAAAWLGGRNAGLVADLAVWYRPRHEPGCHKAGLPVADQPGWGPWPRVVSHTRPGEPAAPSSTPGPRPAGSPPPMKGRAAAGRRGTGPGRAK
jgi:hypothetical protein